MESVEQPGPWRRTALRQYHRIGRACFAVQVGQDSLDNRRVFYAGNDLDLPRATLAGRVIDPDAAQLSKSSPHGAQPVSYIQPIQLSPID
jgi:hypothetical protein